MTIKEIKSAILAEIKPICKNVYFNRAPITYPRVRLELRKLGQFEPIKRYILYVDFYGKIDEAAALEDMAESVYSALNGVLTRTENGTIYAHSDNGEIQTADDTAADIKHITATIPLRIL